MTNSEIYVLSLPLIAAAAVMAMGALLRYRPWHRRTARTAQTGVSYVAVEPDALIRRLGEAVNRSVEEASGARSGAAPPSAGTKAKALDR
jgi:hypothetical protein